MEFHRDPSCSGGQCPQRTLIRAIYVKFADPSLPKRAGSFRYLHRSARLVFSRYLLWQFAHAVVRTSAAINILS
jgi:hypothetical protein